AAALGLAAAWAATLSAAEPTAAAPARPKLLVLVVFDQFRGDYLSRWDSLFTDDGFHRLEREGTWFTNCHYPYACTETGPGHASLGTGASPDRHGIIANDWYDRTAGATVCCAPSDRYQTVYAAPPAAKGNDTGAGPP